jgi:hypothetical protein
MKGQRFKTRVSAVAVFIAEFLQLLPCLVDYSADSENPFVTGEAFYLSGKCL